MRRCDIEKWLMPTEKLECYLSDTVFPLLKEKVLIVTSRRALLLSCSIFGNCELSDKSWEQFACVRQRKHWLNGAQLKLDFLRHYPTFKTSDEPLDDPWILDGLSTVAVDRIYPLLKKKEDYWREWRHKEYMKYQAHHLTVPSR